MTQWQDPYGRRPVDINAYAPPKRSGAALWFVLAAVVLAGIVLAVIFMRPAAPDPAASPKPSVTSAEPSGPGMPFTMPDSQRSSGRWEILSQEWTGGGLLLEVQVHADVGTVSYAFVAFLNSTSGVYEPTEPPLGPPLDRGTLVAGQSESGYVFLPMPRGDTTVILTTRAGQQMSALPITG